MLKIVEHPISGTFKQKVHSVFELCNLPQSKVEDYILAFEKREQWLGADIYHAGDFTVLCAINSWALLDVFGVHPVGDSKFIRMVAYDLWMSLTGLNPTRSYDFSSPGVLRLKSIGARL